MIEDLLDISRVSRGKFHLKFETVGVSTIVDEALLKVWHFVEQREHELKVQRTDEDLFVWGDPLRLQQVLSNLLLNAAIQRRVVGASCCKCWPRKNALCFAFAITATGCRRNCLVGCSTCTPRWSGRLKVPAAARAWG